MYLPNNNLTFRSKWGEDIFTIKYMHDGCETMPLLVYTLVHEVCDGLMPADEIDQLIELMIALKVIAGGRYLYYAGRANKFYNNCYLLRGEEDTREDWGALHERAEVALMTGGGIGVDYSRYRARHSLCRSTGGVASGPLPAMYSTNEIGRNVKQGGGRRSAIYASLDRTHGDVWEFLNAKNWQDMAVGSTGYSYWDVKCQDPNFPCPLDMTNISVNYKTDWLMRPFAEFPYGDYTDPVFEKNVFQALSTGEPGFSFNFFDKEDETLRNACTEVTSSDDSDVCNLASLNMGRIESLEEMETATYLTTKFLLCGTLRAKLPYQKVYDVRERNRRLGLGLLGVHEWLLKRGYRYEFNPELQQWMEVYKNVSNVSSAHFADQLGVSRPIGNRAIAPTGTIGILAGTTTGIEPLYAVAYKRRYLKNGHDWHYQYVVDGAAQELIDLYGIDPDSIETALDLALDVERRIKFQADMQDYVDHAISSTINLPPWDTEHNNESHVRDFARTLAKYAPRLRGFTCYPDGARGGQPLEAVPYTEAIKHKGKEYVEMSHDICDITGKGGSCGV